MNCPNCGHDLTPDTLQINLKDYDVRTVQHGPRYWRVQWLDRELAEWCDTGPPHNTRKAATAYALGQIMRGDFALIRLARSDDH